MQPLILLHKVEPTYPEQTRRENARLGYAFQEVKVHLVVDKNGQVSKILSTQGVCSLAESSVSAVRQWRYQPYLVNGTPVDVDTYVVITFRFIHKNTFDSKGLPNDSISIEIH